MTLEDFAPLELVRNKREATFEQKNHHEILYRPACRFISLLAQAQTNTWRFDFGNGATAAGYNAVGPASFTYRTTGYGLNSVLT